MSGKNKIEPPRKKRRLRPTTVSVDATKKNWKNQQQQQHDVEDAFEQAQQVKLKRIEFKLAANIAATIAQRPAQVNQEQTPTGDSDEGDEVPSCTTGFGVFEPAKEEVSEVEDEELQGAGEEFVSLEEIRMNRMAIAGKFCSVYGFRNVLGALHTFIV